ncbi:M48 family metalloprotease [Hymenobacter sp. BT188]|uniref:M56 family metallopeptidase n=1 Tax=Hymenobacter sp. BT188 TaxID=2763504 RepID=UPI0016510999|nr:M56 family metallopeptidase [Hymenobacter sp. BT188]MBC6606557.1 M48 family metalloprotease [Hymenobacter sp. BT188]
MNWLEHLLSPAVVRALGWTIVHSLWQGAVVALALAGLLLLLRQHTARIRYRVAGVALVAMLGLSAVTFSRYYLADSSDIEAGVPTALANTTAATPTVVPASLGGNLPLVYAFDKHSAPAPTVQPAAPTAAADVSWLPYFDQHLPLIVTAWLLGLLAMTLRFLGGLAYLDRLRHYRVRPLPAVWQRRLTELGERAGLRRSVTLLESALVKAPLVAGHLKPVILLPLGTISGLSQAHLEAILAHELAHIIRRDYLMNLVQSITEILFFYHPGVWFVNACLRTERENCCDDMATTMCGSPLTLAQALTGLAELGHDRFSAPRLAVAAVGPDGSLLSRVRRLVQRRSDPTFSEGFMAAVVVLGGIVLLGVSTAFSLADPHFKINRNETMAAGNAWRAELMPGLLVAPSVAKIAPQGPLLEAVEVSDKDKDKDKKKRRRKEDDNRVVIIQDGARGRRDAGTVILERDKKGRVTEMYINGNRIDAQDLNATRKKSKDEGTQVIRLNSGRRIVRAEAPATVRFDYENGSNLIVTGRNWDELREVLPTITDRIDRRRLVQVERNLNGSAQLAELVDIDRGLDIDKGRIQALRSAEQALRAAEQRADSEAEKEKIRQKIETIRQEREQVRDQQQTERDKMQVERDRQQVDRDRERTERDKARAERDARVSKTEDGIIDELVKDGLIKDKSRFNFVLTAKDLHVDGKKQSEALFAKYKKMYEQGVGRTIGATDTMTLSYNGGNVNRIYMNRARGNSNITPPAPPAVPAVPGVPGVPAAPAAPSASGIPAPPAPPRAPRAPRAPQPPRAPAINSVDLGNQLRQDGLIGKNDKSYQFQLNATSMTVNGKRQSDELAAKYRQLLGEGKNSKFNMNISIQE